MTTEPTAEQPGLTAEQTELTAKQTECLRRLDELYENELEDGGKRIFTRKNVQQLQDIWVSHGDIGRDLKWPDINGDMHSIEESTRTTRDAFTHRREIVKSEGNDFRPDRESLAELGFIPYQGIKDEGGNFAPRLGESLLRRFTKHTFASYIGSDWIRAETWAEFRGSLHEKLVHFGKEWQDSQTKKDLLECLEKVDKSTPVKKIVAIGLGSLRGTRERHVDHLHHHLAVLDAAQHLRKQSQQAEKVVVWFQDPSYHDDDQKWLGKYNDDEEWNKDIHVVFPQGRNYSFTEGYLEVDATTLVWVGENSKGPVEQIIADITVPFYGPAGFFWDTRGYCDPKEWTRQKEVEDYIPRASRNPLNEHVIEMVKNYDKHEIFDTVDGETVPLWDKALWLKKPKATKA
ncbi:hypothetical protein K491DRAFT_720950 [Lophiostoma macrostomum CBS 122681]|uniref:SRR1-like domain-containing protein n=1 Tax=Lophiostoma macrostomum CBS 122681 TaxID=1314788 RepID=A0A6A6SVF1_9PLEO|nr:hypothetical protein K491DRAFT_720950 [Lophiostoma macrostomum CBS 122681]